MIGLTLASWREYRRRYVATFLAIFLGVGFCAATLSLTAAASRGAGDAAAVQYSKADVVAVPGRMPSRQLVQRLAGLSGVADVAVVQTSSVTMSWPMGHAASTEQVSELPLPAGLRWQQLASGGWPARAGQIAVDAGLAAAKGVALGGTVELGGHGVARRTLTVVGLLSSEKGANGVSAVVAAPGSLAHWGLHDAMSEIDIAAADGVSQSTLATAVQHAAPSAAVSTADALQRRAVSDLSNQVDVIGRFLTGFAFVALCVAGLVISNTFRIVMAQRIRDLALLRCVGAERWQIFVLTVGEALLLGTLASLAGTAAGIAIGAGLVEILNHTAIPVALALVAPGLATVMVPFAAGLVMAVAAVLAPAAWAARVAPLAALRSDGQAVARSRAGLVQLGLGLMLGLLGSALLALAVITGRLLPGLAGGLISFGGVLILAPFVVPSTIRVVGRASRLLPRRLRGGVPADLSVLNAVRNPRRTAATAGALIVGVTLISMMSVGAASVSASESQALDRVTPIDLTVAGGTLPVGLLQRARQVEGVEQIVVARGETVQTAQGSTEVASLTQAQLAAVVRDPVLRDDAADPAIVVVPISAQGAVPGGGSTPFTLAVGDVRVRVTPVLSSLTSGPMLVSPSVAERLGGRLRDVALYARVSDGADPQTVVSGLQDAIASISPHGPLTVSGGYVKRSTYDRAVSVMLLIATVMLGMAVLIALVGVGNTLSQSVLERGREHGLLRALGLTTGQLRLLLANEAVLIAGTAAAIGTALGVAYGWAGTLTLLHGTASHTPTLAIPVARLAVIIAVAMAAGLLASVLPARRAVRQSPAAALSDE